MDLKEAVGQRLLFAFTGKERPSAEILRAFREHRPAGITLFRSLNIDHPAQVRQLTQELQAAARAAGLPSLLIAADQEGGQLMAVGEGTTPLPGNLALGATRSPDLARQAGEVLGRELAAMGINVDYAPCCDVNVNPHNPVVGTRSFGEESDMVAQLSAALVSGLQSSGVAATAKHFPGHGDTSSDSHHSMPVIPHSLDRLRRVELPPFAAAIHAGVKLVMTGHLALPAVESHPDLPATMSPAILQGLLRRELRFNGVIVTDAMDMGAIRQGENLGAEAVRAAAAGAGLLLITSDPVDQVNVAASLLQAAQDGSLDRTELEISVRRIQDLKNWLAVQNPPPDLSVVGCAAHQAVAAEIAARSITLVRDHAGLLPIRLQPGQRLGVIVPQPRDLTPADTSSYVTPVLAEALRVYHPLVDEFIVPYASQDGDIAPVLEEIRECDLVIIGTINAFSQPAQANLVRAILRSGTPTVIVAMRMPYDLKAFPEASTYVCTYSILAPSMHALARALWGEAGFPGRLPVSID